MFIADGHRILPFGATILPNQVSFQQFIGLATWKNPCIDHAVVLIDGDGHQNRPLVYQFMTCCRHHLAPARLYAVPHLVARQDTRWASFHCNFLLAFTIEFSVSYRSVDPSQVPMMLSLKVIDEAVEEFSNAFPPPRTPLPQPGERQAGLGFFT